MPTKGANSSSNGDGNIPRAMNGIDTNGTSTNGVNGTKLDSPEVSAAAPKVQDDAETVPAARSVKEDEISSTAKPEVESAPKESEGSMEKGLDVGDDKEGTQLYLEKVGLEKAHSVLSKSLSSPVEKSEEEAHVGLEKDFEAKEITSPSVEKENVIEDSVGAEKAIHQDEEPEINMKAKGLGSPAGEEDVVAEDKLDEHDSTISQSETHPVGEVEKEEPVEVNPPSSNANDTTELIIEVLPHYDGESEILGKSLEKGESEDQSEHSIKDVATKELSGQDEDKQEEAGVDSLSSKELDEKDLHDDLEKTTSDTTPGDDIVHSNAAITSDQQFDTEAATETKPTDHESLKQADTQERSLAGDEANEISEVVPKSLDLTDEDPKEHTSEMEAKQSETVPESSRLDEEDKTPSTYADHSDATTTDEKEPQESGNHEELAIPETSIEHLTQKDQPITVKSLDVEESIPSTTEEDEHVTSKSLDVEEEPTTTKLDDFDDEEIPADWMPRNLDEVPVKKEVVVNTPQETTSPIHVAEASIGVLEGDDEEMTSKDEEPEAEVKVENIDAVSGPVVSSHEVEKEGSKDADEEPEIAVKNLHVVPEQVESSHSDKDREAEKEGPEADIEIKNLDALPTQGGDSKGEESEAEIEVKNLDILPVPVESLHHPETKDEESEAPIEIKNLDALPAQAGDSKNEEPEAEIEIKHHDTLPGHGEDPKNDESEGDIKMKNLDVLPEPTESPHQGEEPKNDESEVEIEIKNLDASAGPSESSHQVEEKESKEEDPELDIQPRDLDALPEPIVTSHYDEEESKEPESDIEIKNDALPESSHQAEESEADIEVKSRDALPESSLQGDEQESKEDSEPEIQTKSLDALPGHIKTLPHFEEKEPEDEDLEIQPRNLDEPTPHSEIANQDEPEVEIQPKDLDDSLQESSTNEEPVLEIQPKSLDLETDPSHPEDSELEIQPRNLDELALHSEVANQDKPELDIQPKDLDSHLGHTSVNEGPVVETPPKSPALEAQPSHHDDSEVEIRPKYLDELSLHSKSDEPDVEVQSKDLDSLPTQTSEHDDPIAESQPKSLDLEKAEPSQHEVELQPRNLDEAQLHSENDEHEVDIKRKDLDSLQEHTSVPEDAIQSKSLDSERGKEKETTESPPADFFTPLTSMIPRDDSSQSEDYFSGAVIPADEGHEVERTPRNLDAATKLLQTSAPTKNQELEHEGSDSETQPSSLEVASGPEHEEVGSEMQPKNLDVTSGSISDHDEPEVEIQPRNLDELHQHAESTDHLDKDHSDDAEPKVGIQPENLDELASIREESQDNKNVEMISDLPLAAVEEPITHDGSVENPSDGHDLMEESTDKHESVNHYYFSEEESDNESVKGEIEIEPTTIDSPKNDEVEETKESITPPLRDEPEIAKASVADEHENYEDSHAEIDNTPGIVSTQNHHIQSEPSVNVMEVQTEDNEDDESPALEKKSEEQLEPNNTDKSIESLEDHHDHESVKSEPHDDIANEETHRENNEHDESLPEQETAHSHVATEGNASYDEGSDTEPSAAKELPIETASPTLDESTAQDLPEDEDSRAASPTGKHSMDSVRSLTEKDLFAMMSGSYKQPAMPEEVSQQDHDEAVPEPKDLDQVTKEIDDTAEENESVAAHGSSLPLEQSQKDDGSEDDTTSVKEDSKGVQHDDLLEPKDLDQAPAAKIHDKTTSVKEDSNSIEDDDSFEPKDLDRTLATTSHDVSASVEEVTKDLRDHESTKPKALDQNIASITHDDIPSADTLKENHSLGDETASGGLTSDALNEPKELDHDTSEMSAGISLASADAQNDNSQDDPFSDKAEIEDSSDAKVNEFEDHTKSIEHLADASPDLEHAKDQETLSEEVKSHDHEVKSSHDVPEPKNLDLSGSDTPVHAASTAPGEPDDGAELAVKDLSVVPEAVHSHSASLTDVEEDQMSPDETKAEEPTSAKESDLSFEPNDLDQHVVDSEETSLSNDEAKSLNPAESECLGLPSTHVEKDVTDHGSKQEQPVSRDLDLPEGKLLDHGFEHSKPIESANPTILAANIEQDNTGHDDIESEHPVSKDIDTVFEPKDLDQAAAKELDLSHDDPKVEESTSENHVELEPKIDNMLETSDSKENLSDSPDAKDEISPIVDEPTSIPRELDVVVDSEETAKEPSAHDESHNETASPDISVKNIDTLTEPNELEKLVEKTDAQTLASEDNQADHSAPDNSTDEIVPTEVIPKDLDASTEPKETEHLVEKTNSQEKALDLEDIEEDHSAHNKAIDETASAEVAPKDLDSSKELNDHEIPVKVDVGENALDSKDIEGSHSLPSNATDETASAVVIPKDIDVILEPNNVHEPVEETKVPEEDLILPSDKLVEGKSESTLESPEIVAKNLDILLKEDELEDHASESKANDGLLEQNDIPAQDHLKALDVSTENTTIGNPIDESDVDEEKVASTPLEEAVQSLAVAQEKDSSTSEKLDEASLPAAIPVESEPVSESDEESMSGSEAPSVETERFNALLEGHEDSNLENEQEKQKGPESDSEDGIETPAQDDTVSKRLGDYHDNTASWVAANREEEPVPHKDISESDVEESQKAEASDTHDFELESSTVSVPLPLGANGTDLHGMTPQEPKEDSQLPVATDPSSLLAPEESNGEEFDSKTATPTRETSFERPITPAEDIGRALDFELESPHTVGDVDDLFDDDDSEDEFPMRDERGFVHNGQEPLSGAYNSESARGFDEYEGPFESHTAPNPNLFANLVNTIRPEIALVRQMSDIPESPENHLDDSDYVGNSFQPSEDQIAEHYDDEHDQFDQGHYAQHEDNYLRTRSHTADTVPSFETYAHSDEEDSPPGTPIDEIANVAQEALLNEHLISSSWPVRPNVDPQESEQDLKPQASPMQAEFDPFNPSQYGAYVTPKASRTDLVAQKNPDSISEKIASAETMHSRPQSLSASQVQQFEDDMSSFRPKSLDASDSSPFDSSPLSSNNPYARPSSRLSMDATPPLRSVSRLSIDPTRNRGTSSPTPPPRSISRLSIEAPFNNEGSALTPPPKSPRRSTVTSSSSPMSIFQKTRSLFESSNSTPLLPSIGLFRGGTSPKPQASPAAINRDRPGSLYHDTLPPAISPQPSRLKHEEYDEEEDSMLVPRSLDPIPKPPSPTFTHGSRPNSLRSRNSNEDTKNQFYDNPETNNPYDGAGYGGSPSRGLESSVHNPRRTENTPLLNRRREDDDDDGLLY